MATILHVCGYFDPSGDVTRSVTELNKHSKHHHEVIIRKKHPNTSYQFVTPELGHCPSSWYVDEAFQRADAVIYHLVGWDSPFGYGVDTPKPKAFRNANVYFNAGTGKFECHPTFFANPVKYKLAASCHMAARQFMGSSTRFLPALIPIWDLLYTPDWNYRQPCVAYSKHADDRNLTARLDYYGMRSLRLVDVPHQEALAERRRLATITIDNVNEGHYGLAGTESMAQGVPAIAWNHSITLDQLYDIAPGVGSKFINATDVGHAVRTAQYNEHLLEDDRHTCREWIEKFYDSRYLIERYWEPFCDELIA